jgi:hypothetical protein
MENYSKWPVWKLEERLEEISRQRDALRQEARTITAIRDEKLSRGETQLRPVAQLKAAVVKKAGILEKLGLRKPKGPDQVIRVGG